MKNNTFSIIAGKYRRAKFEFSGDITLRPTPNKVRETLFNWLQFDVIDARVLDPFAGSGALGFEALSRGASSVVLIEKNPTTSIIIQKNITKLADKNIALHTGDFFTQNFLQSLPVFDIVLLDPPFNCGLIKKSLDVIIQNNLIHKDSVIYLESEYLIEDERLKIIKQKKSASVHYCLATQHI